jgi:serine/threonine-protein kinase
LQQSPSSVESPSPPNGGLKGRVLGGRYFVEDVVFGHVYRALDQRDSDRRKVAVKHLDAAGASQPDRIEMFEHEIIVSSHINVPGVPRFLLALEEAGERYAFFEYIDGASLADRAEARVSAADAVDVLVRLCDILERVHGSGVIHCDVAPGNVLLGFHDDVVRLVDFGIAQSTRLPPEKGVLRGQREGRVFGPPGYMSPEQASGKAVSPQSDVYSAGCVLLNLLTGERLPGVKNPRDLLGRVADTELRSILDKALAARPPDRYASIADMRTELTRWQRLARPEPATG